MLGIVAIVLLLVCGLGLLVAVAGIIVAVIAITKRSNKGRAVVGLILSILTLVIGAIIIGVVINWANKNNIGECFDTPAAPDPGVVAAVRAGEAERPGLEGVTSETGR